MFYRSLLLLQYFFISCFTQDQSDDDSDFSQPNANQQTEEDLNAPYQKIQS